MIRNTNIQRITKPEGNYYFESNLSLGLTKLTSQLALNFVNKIATFGSKKKLDHNAEHVALDLLINLRFTSEKLIFDKTLNNCLFSGSPKHFMIEVVKHTFSLNPCITHAVFRNNSKKSISQKYNTQ